jgi:phosphocarrier protein HPr
MNSLTTSPECQAADLIVPNQLGLHARAAAKIATLAQQYESTIIIEKDGMQGNARHILDILSLNCPLGTKIRILVQGPDAPQALQALQELFYHQFGET